MIYQARGVLLPALRTISMFQKTIKSEMSVPLNELLLTSRGFKFFYQFTAGEFSQENPLCFQAIEKYRRKTTLPALRDIFDKYFAPGSPLQVNIPGKVVDELRIFVKSASATTPIEKLQSAFDSAETELLALMSGDSYRRFLTSAHYEAYQSGVPEPHLDEESYLSQQSSGSKSDPKKDRNGESDGQRQPSQVEMLNIEEDRAVSRDSMPHSDEKASLDPAPSSLDNSGGGGQSEPQETTESYVV